MSTFKYKNWKKHFVCVTLLTFIFNEKRFETESFAQYSNTINTKKLYLFT